MKKVYFVDGDVAFSSSCRTTLEAAGFHVELYQTEKRVYEAFCRSEPAAIILNMSDETFDSVQFMQKVRHMSTVPVILLTDNAGEFDEVFGLRLGADTVLRKPASAFLVAEWIKPLVRRHKMVAQGGTTVNGTERRLELGDLVMLLDCMIASWKGHELPLTVSEFRLMSALVSRPGIVKTREVLLDLIHDHGDYVDDRSIDSHVKRVRLKIREVDPAFNCIDTIYGMGYRYVVPAVPKMPMVSSSELIPFPMQIAG